MGEKRDKLKIWEKRGINIRFRARALPLNPKVQRKAECLSLTNNIITFRPAYEYFNQGSSEIQKDFLAPGFRLNGFFFFGLVWFGFFV